MIDSLEVGSGGGDDYDVSRKAKLRNTGTAHQLFILRVQLKSLTVAKCVGYDHELPINSSRQFKCQKFLHHLQWTTLIH